MVRRGLRARCAGLDAGDVLIVCYLADSAAYPLLFQTYADRIDVDFAEHMVGVSHERLIADELFAMLLCLIGSRHLWCGIHNAGRAWAPSAALLNVRRLRAVAVGRRVPAGAADRLGDGGRLPTARSAGVSRWPW